MLKHTIKDEGEFLGGNLGSKSGGCVHGSMKKNKSRIFLGTELGKWRRIRRDPQELRAHVSTSFDAFQQNRKTSWRSWEDHVAKPEEGRVRLTFDM